MSRSDRDELTQPYEPTPADWQAYCDYLDALPDPGPTEAEVAEFMATADLSDLPF